jgi:hypothetical protein
LWLAQGLLFPPAHSRAQLCVLTALALTACDGPFSALSEAESPGSQPKVTETSASAPLSAAKPAAPEPPAPAAAAYSKACIGTWKVRYHSKAIESAVESRIFVGEIDGSMRAIDDTGKPFEIVEATASDAGCHLEIEQKRTIDAWSTTFHLELQSTGHTIGGLVQVSSRNQSKGTQEIDTTGLSGIVMPLTEDAFSFDEGQARQEFLDPGLERLRKFCRRARALRSRGVHKAMVRIDATGALIGLRYDGKEINLRKACKGKLDKLNAIFTNRSLKEQSFEVQVRGKR